MDKMQTVSLKTYLTGLIWVSVLPLVVLAIYLAANHIHGLHQELDREPQDEARNIATVIDRHLGAQIAALQMLVDDATRWEEYYQEARGFLENFGGHVILADLSTQMILNTRAHFEAALPKLPVPKGHAAAPTALATGKPAVGDRFLGPVAKQPLVAIAVPVIGDSQTRFLLLRTYP
jgi:hypothetical protein